MAPPWDGSGNVTRTNGTNTGQSVWQDDRDDGVNIRADRHDTHDEDLANSLENTVALDGQNTTTTDNAILRYSTGTDNKFIGVSIGANEVVGRISGDITGIAIGTASGEIPLADDVLKADPEHATDNGTDTYASATNTTPPADGVVIIRDFQTPNTTTTPTLDGKTLTSKDGSALWANAVSGVHALQRDQAADTYLLLDPRPTDANVNNAPVARDANGRAKFADPSAAQDAATKAWTEANHLAIATTSSDPSLSFGTWRIPNADKPTLVKVGISVETNGVSVGQANFDVDESGGTTPDYFDIVFSGSSHQNGLTVHGTITAYLPAGASYRINNVSDPNSNNSIRYVREFTL